MRLDVTMQLESEWIPHLYDCMLVQESCVIAIDVDHCFLSGSFCDIRNEILNADYSVQASFALGV